jgi:hypothetical protein
MRRRRPTRRRCRSSAVDKFRADRNLNDQGNPAGLVDARMIEVLRAAYLEKKKKR